MPETIPACIADLTEYKRKLVPYCSFLHSSRYTYRLSLTQHVLRSAK